MEMTSFSRHHAPPILSDSKPPPVHIIPSPLNRLPDMSRLHRICQYLREWWSDCALLMPARDPDDLSDQYTFPQARYAGQGHQQRRAWYVCILLLIVFCQ